MPTSQNNTEQSKLVMLAALNEEYMIVGRACRKAKVGRTTYYQWLKDDPEFAAKVAEMEDMVLDNAEYCLAQAVHKDMDTAAAFKTLQYKGRKRGWSLRTEVVDKSTVRDALADLSDDELDRLIDEDRNRLRDRLND